MLGILRQETWQWQKHGKTCGKHVEHLQISIMRDSLWMFYLLELELLLDDTFKRKPHFEMLSKVLRCIDVFMWHTCIFITHTFAHTHLQV